MQNIDRPSSIGHFAALRSTSVLCFSCSHYWSQAHPPHKQIHNDSMPASRGSKCPREALEDRPRQIHKALNAMLADPRFATHADPSRLGMMGFSYGGAVALIVAGAVPDLAHLAAYCRDRTDDPKACDGAPTDGSLAHLVGKRSPDALAMEALVLME